MTALSTAGIALTPSESIWRAVVLVIEEASPVVMLIHFSGSRGVFGYSRICDYDLLSLQALADTVNHRTME